MELIRATNDFVIAGVARAGFPILLWSNMESCRPVNQFLRHYLSRGQIGSRRSWGVIGQALYDYFSFLEAHDLDWTDVDRGEDEKELVAGYRDYCRETVGHKRATIRLRLVYVCEFYEYAYRKGWIARLPFTLEERRSLYKASFLAHASARGSTIMVRDVMPRHQPTVLKFLPKAEVLKLLAAPSNVHHRMLIRLALHTGMRREELGTFPVAYVFDPDRKSGGTKNVRIQLDPDDGHGMRTKGDRPRELLVSKWFMRELWHYVKHHRGERIPEGVDVKTLFVNQDGKPYADGGKGIERIVREIGERCGVQVHTHMLRHTYATHTLAVMQRNRDQLGIDPLVFVQKQLGHASIQTTMMYLHMIDELADQAVLAYDDELNEWMSEAQG